MTKRSEKTVLFLCTGNYYRSRFAEALFNSVAGKMGLPWRASSRGLALERGVNNVGPMAASAVQALEAMGVLAGDAITRMPAQVTEDDLEGAALVVALKHAEHLPLLQERFPAWAEKAEFWHVDDAPEVLGLIEQEVMGLVARILGGSQRLQSQPTEATAPASPPVKEPAKKPVTLKVGRETAGRRGKGVTTVFDLPLDDDGVRELAALLKQRCGTGGTVKDGRIEIQGDQRERIVAELEKLGYKVNRVGAEMARRNRATPFGEIVAVPERGTFMGNRGVLHDEEGRIRREWQLKRWIVCVLEFRGRKRQVMTPGHYTELFFLDEATALAAGHRPCAECRHARFLDFCTAWGQAHPDGGRSARPTVQEIDDRLHAERVAPDRSKHTFQAALDSLPDGVFVALPAWGEEAYLVRGDDLLAWSHGGYRERRRRPQGEEVRVLTPASTVAAIRAGYVPDLHLSALALT